MVTLAKRNKEERTIRRYSANITKTMDTKERRTFDSTNKTTVSKPSEYHRSRRIGKIEARQACFVDKYGTEGGNTEKEDCRGNMSYGTGGYRSHGSGGEWEGTVYQGGKKTLGRQRHVKYTKAKGRDRKWEERADGRISGWNERHRTAIIFGSSPPRYDAPIQ